METVVRILHNKDCTKLPFENRSFKIIVLDFLSFGNRMSMLHILRMKMDLITVSSVAEILYEGFKVIQIRYVGF